MDILEENTSLSSLNVESNFLSPELLAKLLRASLRNQTLVEFHAENQVLCSAAQMSCAALVRIAIFAFCAVV